MDEDHPHLKIFWAAVLSLLLSLTAFLAWGCGKAGVGTEEEQEERQEEGEEEVQLEGTITLTLYFRYSTETDDYLAPEERTIPATYGVARAATEGLIEGPGADSGLLPVLPDTVRILDIGIEDGLCTLNVSKEIIIDASQVGPSAAGEMLALAAIADTLTGIEGIDRVKLLVEGVQSGEVDGRHVEDFWGHVGLPEILERDENIIFKNGVQ